MMGFPCYILLHYQVYLYEHTSLVCICAMQFFKISSQFENCVIV
jgi:hypothetical protein